MKDYLILRLQGVMQTWGAHTFEDYRPSHIFPTRSGLVGLLGACLGIDREDFQGQRELSASFSFCARLDDSPNSLRKISDFHTVLDARKVDGKPNKNPVVSVREYLCDAKFTVAMEFTGETVFSMDRVHRALRRPIYTPFLGRRSCPLTVPLCGGIIQAEDLHSALAKIPPGGGILYSELDLGSPNPLVVRDTPAGYRSFATRRVYIHSPEVGHVPE